MSPTHNTYRSTQINMNMLNMTRATAANFCSFEENITCFPLAQKLHTSSISYLMLGNPLISSLKKFV